MDIKPTNDLLLIRRCMPDEVKTDWGFELPKVEDNLDTPFTGEVLATGPGKLAKLAPAAQEVVDVLQAIYTQFCNSGLRSISPELMNRAGVALAENTNCMGRLPMTVKAGDKVVFSKNGFQKFKIEGQEVIALQEASCLGVLD